LLYFNIQWIIIDMASRRKTIINNLVAAMKNIDGGTSSYNANYTYNLNVFENVFRKLKFVDEVNDHPSLYLNAGLDIRNYESGGYVTSDLQVIIRGYIKDDESPVDMEENLIEDIEHILSNYSDSNNGVMQITVEDISTDEGLIAPFGIIEVGLSISYELK